MSRIDEALKRVAGVVAPEPRMPVTLERYASEGTPPRLEDSQRETRVEEQKKIANFVAHGPRPVEGRPAAVKAVVAQALPAPSDDGEPKVDSEPLVDVRQLFDYVGFVGRSVRRHKLLAFATVTLVLGLTGAAAVLLPKSYHVQTKLLAQRNAVMAALSNPGRAVPWDADAPTRAAAETVLRRDNLISLITQVDLMREWERTRAPILKLKDWLVTVVTRQTPTADEKLDALVELLEVRMVVVAGPVGDGTVTIDLDWPDAEMGYRLVEAAQQSFLDARQAAETAAINEAIAILERYSTSLHEDVNRTLAELQRKPARGGNAPLTPQRTNRAPRLPVIAGLPSLASLGVPELDPSLESDPETTRLKKSLEQKRLELSRLEATRQTQLAEAQGRLSQLKTVYTANHPSVLSLEQNVAGLGQDSQQALSLAAEIEELQADHDKRVEEANELQIQSQLARRSAATAAKPVPPVAYEAAERSPQPAPAGDTPQVGDYAGLRLRSELRQLESVLERTDGARIELAVSQAAFKYRYTVVRPAQVPRDPTFPNRRLVFMAGLLASLMLALAVVVAKDLLSNRILEPWQIERRLGLPVLGTLRTA